MINIGPKPGGPTHPPRIPPPPPPPPPPPTDFHSWVGAARAWGRVALAIAELTISVARGRTL